MIGTKRGNITKPLILRMLTRYLVFCGPLTMTRGLLRNAPRFHVFRKKMWKKI
jgi:hypothetical protein